MVRMDPGAQLKAWRNRRRISAQTLATHLGLTVGTIYQWETGRIAQPDHNRIETADAFLNAGGEIVRAYGYDDVTPHVPDRTPSTAMSASTPPVVADVAAPPDPREQELAALRARVRALEQTVDDLTRTVEQVRSELNAPAPSVPPEPTAPIVVVVPDPPPGSAGRRRRPAGRSVPRTDETTP